MIRSALCTGLVLLAAMPAIGQPASRPARSVLVETTVLKPHDDRTIVAFSAGRQGGVSMGDRFWVLNDEGVAATGAVYFLTDAESVGRFDEPGREVTAGQPVVMLSPSTTATLRRQLPPGVTIHGQVSRLPPGLQTAWLDVGRRAGLASNDGILVRRKGIPIARGRLELIEDDASLCTLTPLVQNAVTQSGDQAELWPEPARRARGQLNSVVLALAPGQEEPTVTFVGTAADGLSEGRLVDLYRDDTYVGAAIIVAVSNPLSQARLIAPASPDVPKVGDLAIVRAAPGEPLPPILAVVFRVEPDRGYCLFAAGESDGITVGEKFVVRRPDPARPGSLQEVAELTVATVKVDFSGADLRSLRPNSPPVAQWEIAERRSALLPVWEAVGAVERVNDTSRTIIARTDGPSPVVPGEVLRLARPGDHQPLGAITLSHRASRAVLYVPPGWGDLRHAGGAQVSRKAE